jgi:hypothetical protein
MTREGATMFALPVAKPQKKVAPAPSLQRKVGPPLPAGLQRKIVVGKSNDPLEREADRVADQVMAMAGPIGPLDSAPPQLSRACAACEDDEKAQMLQGKLDCAQAVGGEAPDIVREVLGSSGEPLDPSARAYFEPRFQSGFGRVRVHAGARAADSAAAIKARAYTVGHDIAFADRQYRPGSREGRRLIAHELAHVVQQRGGGPIGSAAGDSTAASRSTLRRADPDAVSEVMKMRTVVGAGIQFLPANVTDTRIGPVSVKGGLISHGASRLSVVIGANLTPRILARELLPLWITATPYTPPQGGPAVVPGALSEEQLAKGLLVYNAKYLPVPGMTGWQAGLQFPLPVGIDEKTGVATVNPQDIRGLAAGFDPKWVDLLDQPAAAALEPPAKALHAAVAALLALYPAKLAQSTVLRERAMTNAQAALPYIAEALSQLGAASFEVALTIADGLVDRDVARLAAQRAGARIISVIDAEFSLPSVVPTAAQKKRVARAKAMFGRAAGIAAADPSAPVAKRAEKTVSVDTVKLNGSAHNPATQIAVANMIYAQCNVRFAHGVDATASKGQTTGWLGAGDILDNGGSCKTPAPEELPLFQGATTAFTLGSRIRAFFVSALSSKDRGYSRPPYCSTGGAAAPLVNMAVVANSGNTTTLAHEFGHILLDSGAHTSGSIMQPIPRPNEITDPQCATIYKNA